MTVLQILAIVGLAVLCSGCAKTSEVDKCVEAWEESMKSTPESEKKAEERFYIRMDCMKVEAGTA